VLVKRIQYFSNLSGDKDNKKIRNRDSKKWKNLSLINILN